MRTILAALAGLYLVATVFGADAIQLTVKGKSEREYLLAGYQVVVADDASQEVLAAAAELSGFLEMVTRADRFGAEFTVVKASSARPDHQIILGRSRALDDLNLPIDWEALGDEGFVIRTVGRKLVIAGGPRRGTINGVYTFLEDVIGCRWYTPEFSVIPHKPTLSVPPLNIRKVPVFESRYVHCHAITDVNWAARQRLNTFTRGVTYGMKADGTRVRWGSFINEPKIAGSYHYAVGAGVHTLGPGDLLPYSEFGKHPEYFAFVNGKRVKDGRPCLTNPDLLSFVIKRAKDYIKSDPTARVISISQIESPHGCQCPDCQAVFRTPDLMRFVNEVAAGIAQVYPDILVSTLAYQWSRAPPKNMTMGRNVVIRYAPDEACYHHAFDDCGFNAARRIYPDLLEWARIAPRVWVWYYAHAGDGLLPYPNFNCLSRNFKRMRDAGVKGFFIENGITLACGLYEMQAYLFAKLLWDPDYDVQQGIEEFATAYYGAAAPQIISYVKLVNDEQTYTGTSAQNIHMLKFPGLHMRYGARIPIKKDRLGEMNELFEKAAQAAADDPVILERIKRVRLSVQYAIMLFADKNDPIRGTAIRNFFPVAERTNLRVLFNPETGRQVDLERFQKDFLELEL